MKPRIAAAFEFRLCRATAITLLVPEISGKLGQKLTFLSKASKHCYAVECWLNILNGVGCHDKGSDCLSCSPVLYFYFVPVYPTGCVILRPPVWFTLFLIFSLSSWVSVSKVVTCWDCMQELCIRKMNFGHKSHFKTIIEACLSVLSTSDYPFCEILCLGQPWASFSLQYHVVAGDSYYTISINAFHCICAERHILVCFWSPCLSSCGVLDLLIASNS